jgi:hypothetical protein
MAAFRFSSPALKEEDRLLTECPVGLVSRETPYIYEAISAHAYAENGALNPLESPAWLQGALSVVASERHRLRELKDSQRKQKQKSEQGLRTRRQRRGAR